WEIEGKPHLTENGTLTEEVAFVLQRAGSESPWFHEPDLRNPYWKPHQSESEAMMKAMSFGEEHKKLARLVGDWSFTTRMWMMPAQPPSESTGTMHAEAILDGRYIQQYWKSDSMGVPFEARGTDGYDNVTKQYVNTWVDNMSTGISTSTGSCT